MAQPAAGLYVELRALVEKFSQDMNGAVGTVLSGQKKIQGALNTMQKVTQAALFLGGVVALKKLGDGISDLAARGDQVSDVRANFEKLGGTADSLQTAQDAILGVVSATDLMTIANEGLIKQIPGYADNFGTIAKLGNQVADALGLDVKAGIEEVTSALASGKIKQLEAIGVQLSATEAYRDYAKQIGVAADTLDKQQQKEAIQIAAMGKLTEASARFGEVQDSTAAASDAVKVAMSEGLDVIAEAINDNDDLREAYRRLQDTLSEIDWKQVGEDVAWLASILIDKLGGAFKYVEETLRGFVRGLKVLQALPAMGSLTEAQEYVAAGEAIDEQTSAAKRAGEALKELGKVTVFQGDKFVLTQEGLKKAAGAVKELEEAVASGGAYTEKYKSQLEGAKQSLANYGQLVEESTGIVIQHGEKSDKALKQEAKAAEKAAEEIQKLRDKWKEAVADFNQDTKVSGLTKQLEGAVTSLDNVKLDELKLQLEDVVQSGFIAEWQDAINSGAVSLDEVKAQAVEVGKIASEEWSDKMAEAVADHLEDVKQGYASAFDSIAGQFGNMFGDISPDFANLLNGLSSTLSDETKAGLTQGIAEALGTDAAGLNQYAQAGMTVIDAGINAKGTDKATKSNEGTGQAVGAGVGMAIGSIWGPVGAMVGAYLGKFVGGFVGGMMKWGPQNPESIARHAFSNFVEEGFAKLEQVSFYDSKGKLQNYQGDKLNFLEGPTDKFNMPGWEKEMDGWGDKAKQTFMGLGEGLEEVLGLTEDVGAQMALLLGENLAGNIDNARLMVYQLGLSFEEMEEKLVAAGKTGEMSWLEVESAIQGASEAFKPGMAAVGDVKAAMDALFQSGGRGMAALKATRDSAVEAMEAGAKTIEEMGQKMIASGVDPTMVNDFITAVKGRGIKTLEELAAASDRTAGGIVADLTAANEPLRKAFEQMGEDLKLIGEQIRDLPDTKDVFIKVHTEVDENAQKLLNGDLDKPAQSSQVVTVQPKTSAATLGREVNDSSRVSVRNARIDNQSRNAAHKTEYHIAVDARGSDGKGIETKVRKAVMELEPWLSGKAEQRVADNIRRGGSRSRNLGG